MGLIDRVVEQIAAGSTPLRRPDVEATAARLLEIESPRRAESAARVVADSLVGFGPVEELLRDPSVTDVLVNGPGEIWVESGGDLRLTSATFAGAGHLLATIERTIAPLGLRVDRSAPFVDARLPDGSRLHAVVPPACVNGPVVAIRRFTQAVPSLEALIESGSATESQVLQLVDAVLERVTIIVSGGTGTGKTTLLNLLAGRIPAGERVVTIEDSAELRLPGHVVRLEARPPNAEGAGEITIRSLVRSALRLRPDRIIVGEVRGAEALDLISALNTGHRGSLSTVHANSPEEAVWRLETLALTAGQTGAEVVRRQLLAAVGMIVQLERDGRARRVAEIRHLDGLRGST